VNKIEFQK